MVNKQIPELPKGTSITGDAIIPSQRAGDDTKGIDADHLYGYIKNRLLADNDTNMTVGTIFQSPQTRYILPYAAIIDGMTLINKAQYPVFTNWLEGRRSELVGSELYKFRDQGENWLVPNWGGLLPAPGGRYDEDNVNKGIDRGQYLSDAMQRLQGEVYLWGLWWPGNAGPNGVFKAGRKNFGVRNKQESAEVEIDNPIYFDNALVARTASYTRHRMLGINWYIVIAGHISTLVLGADTQNIISRIESLEKQYKNTLDYFTVQYTESSQLKVTPKDTLNITQHLAKLKPYNLQGYNLNGQQVSNKNLLLMLGNNKKLPLFNQVLSTSQCNTIYLNLKLFGKWSDTSGGNLMLTLVDKNNNTIGTHMIPTPASFEALMASYEIQNVIDLQPVQLKLNTFGTTASLTLSKIECTLRGE